MTTTTSAPAGAAALRLTPQEPARIGSIRALRFIVLCLGLAAVAAGTSTFVPALLPFVLAIGPAVIAIVLAWRDGDGALRRLLHSVRIRPAQRRWYLALAIPLLGSLAVVPVAVALGQPTTGLFGSLTAVALFVPIAVLLPAFAEELAWRGYALPHALTSLSPLAASLLLSIPWAAMHFALYLPGQMYAEVTLWPSILTVVSLSVIGTWLYLRTGGSVLMTGLFHALFNFGTVLTWSVDPDAAWAIRPVIFAVIAIAIVALGGFRGLNNGAAPARAAR